MCFINIYKHDFSVINIFYFFDFFCKYFWNFFNIYLQVGKLLQQTSIFSLTYFHAFLSNINIFSIKIP